LYPATDDVLALQLRLTLWLTGSVTLTLADAELLAFALLCAVTTTAPDGTLVGAVYRPADVIVPRDEFPPKTPETNQVTELLLAPDTAALNCRDCPTSRLAFTGEIETDTVAGITETVALDDAELCAAV
jgi:hypothetical protein